MKNIFFYFFLLIIISKKKINAGKDKCFEYSCDECETEEYGKCTKCRESWTLINGTCPCYDPNCALCLTGLAGLNVCNLCKNGYYKNNDDCYCDINNCEKCSENGCLKCRSNYYYNSTLNTCEEEEKKIECYDSNCETCFSEEQGACEYCKNGFVQKKGECQQLPYIDENNTVCPEHYLASNQICYPDCFKQNCDSPLKYMGIIIYAYSCPFNKCLICSGNTIKIYSECDNSEECSGIEGCLNCITSDECVICKQGYYILGGQCIKCIDGCSLCSNNQTCDYCMSGYELDSEGQCNLTYNFDFNVTLYQIRKESLIKQYHPEEVPNPPVEPTQISNIQSTDTTSVENNVIPQIYDINYINCVKYYDNTGRCTECDKLYVLKDNKCVKQCSDENCLDCSLKNDKEYCNSCKSGFTLKEGECQIKCSDENCLRCSIIFNTEFCHQCREGYSLQREKCIFQCEDEYCQKCSLDDRKKCLECEPSATLIDGKCAMESKICTKYFKFCNICIGSEKCIECIQGYEFDDKEGNCVKTQNYAALVFSIIVIVFLLIGALSYCFYRKKQQQTRNEFLRMRRNHANDITIYRNRGENENNLDFSSSFNGSSRVILSKEDLSQEFEMQKNKNEKNIMCQFCKKNPGKFTCDCGCIVCKEHSNLKKTEEGTKVCFACGKTVNTVKAIKYPCHICLQDKLAVCHFKCGCALEVCKSCYINCKMNSDKCPGCRAII